MLLAGTMVVAPTLVYALSVLLYMTNTPRWEKILRGTTVGVIIVCVLVLVYMIVTAVVRRSPAACECECLCFARPEDTVPSGVACVVGPSDECKTRCREICRGNSQYRVDQD